MPNSPAPPSSAEYIDDPGEESEGAEAGHEAPGRNLHLLATAATLAKRREITQVVADIGSRGPQRPTSIMFHALLDGLESVEIRALARKLRGAKFGDLIRPLDWCEGSAPPATGNGNCGQLNAREIRR
jgi:hypothetical protein